MNLFFAWRDPMSEIIKANFFARTVVFARLRHSVLREAFLDSSVSMVFRFGSFVTR